MTNTSTEGRLPRNRRITEPFYPLTWKQALQDYQDGMLTPRGLIYCYFATHLRPGTEIQVEVDQLCALLKLHEATYYRAIGALKAKKKLNIKRGQMKVGMPEIPSLYAQSQSCEFDSQLSEFDSQLSEFDSQSCENGNGTKPIQDEPSRSCANVPNRSNRSLKQTIGTEEEVPPTHPVQTAIDREAIGTGSQDPLELKIESLSAPIKEAGIRPNKTIQTALAELLFTQDSAAAARTVENALSALREQEAKRTVRNPGGFFLAALRRSFTANGAKAEARQRRQADSPCFNQVSVVVNQALQQGDRDFALARLQQLWTEGYQDLVEELCLAWKRDWQFIITNQGVSNADS